MHNTGKLITAEEAMCRIGQATESLVEYINANGGGDVELDRDTLIQLIGIFQGATADKVGTIGLVPAPSEGNVVTVFKGATAWSNGSSGLVPAPSALGA